MRTFLTLTLLTLAATSAGGCATFRYDTADAAPPRITEPTTQPSNENPDLTTPRGYLRAVFVEYPTRLYDLLAGETPSNEALALEDSKIPDRRRIGVNRLVDYRFGKAAPYTTRYRQIAQFDAEPLVRATALRALNRSRDGGAANLFVDGLADENVSVRLEAAKALANVPTSAAVPALLKVFNNAEENNDVRVAAADALRQYRNLEVARALVNSLGDRDFAIAWQSRNSLRAMTGDDRRYDQAAWLQLLTGPTNPLG